MSRRLQTVIIFGATIGVSLFVFSANRERVENFSEFEISSETPRIIDGDTIAFGAAKVRIVGIDAPDGPLRRAAGTHLADLSVRDGGIRCKSPISAASALRACRTPATSFGRRNLYCEFRDNGADVAATMIAHGYAVDFALYSGGKFANLTTKAASERRGLWSVDYSAMRALTVAKSHIPNDC